MKITQQRPSAALLASAAAMGLVLGHARPAEAEEGASAVAATEVAQVVVTGSNIAGQPAISPMKVITRQDIETSGYTDVGEVLRSLPVNFGGGLSPESQNTGVEASYNKTHQSSANLYGLGSSSTLVLLNGQRLPAAGYGIAPDLTMIPLAAVDRIEVVADGASAIYGSDAVAGVVNIITRQDFHGLEARASYGAARGGLGTTTASATAGGARGPFSGEATFQFQNQAPLYTSARAQARAGLYSPIYGGQQVVSGVASGRFEASDRVSLYASGLYSQLHSGDNLSVYPAYEVDPDIHVTEYEATAGMDVRLWPDWMLKLVGTTADSITRYHYDAVLRSNGRILSSKSTRDDNGLWSFDGRLTGPLFATAAGKAQAAFGVSYRKETSRIEENADSRFSRSVTSVYGEVGVPLVDDANAMPFVRTLRLTTAGRYDHYSDVGGIAVPKVGLAWGPIDDLQVTATYSKSFQAPSIFDSAGQYFAQIYTNDRDALGPPKTVLYLGGRGGPELELQPARSTNETVTAKYQPSWLQGFHGSITYFRFKYSNQITAPDPQNQFWYDFRTAPSQILNRSPTPAEIAAFLAGAYSTYQPQLASQVQVIIDTRFRNFSVSRMDGLDFQASYGALTRLGRIDLSLDLLHPLSFEQQLTASSPVIQLAGTIFQPPTWRGRAGAQWSAANWLAAVYWNHTSGELDNRVPAAPLHVGAWDTFDVSLGYDTGPDGPVYLHDLGIKLSVTNLFDTAPPKIAPTGSPYFQQWDGANASVVGRFARVELTKRW
jgi:outer membrane cobalamin receptor